MKHKRALVAVCVAVLAALSPARDACADEQVQTSEARLAAAADAESAEGKKFGEAVAQAFGHEHGTRIQGCATQTKRPDLSNFELFLRLDGAGVVDQAIEAPATAIATCVRDKMPGWKTLPPPHAGFWVKIDVKLKPN